MSNEPAFPFVSQGSMAQHQYCDPGMTLRDYFAGQALVAMGTRWGPETVAEECYRYADAMLEARK